MGRRKIGIDSIVGNPQHYNKTHGNRAIIDSSSSNDHYRSNSVAKAGQSSSSSANGTMRRANWTTATGQRCDRELELTHTLKRLEANRLAQKHDEATVHRLLYEKQLQRKQQQQQQQKLIAAWWQQQRKAQEQQHRPSSSGKQQAIQRATNLVTGEFADDVLMEYVEESNIIDLREDEEEHDDPRVDTSTQPQSNQYVASTVNEDQKKTMEPTRPSTTNQARLEATTLVDAVSFSETEEEMVAKSLCSISAGVGLREGDRIPKTAQQERAEEATCLLTRKESLNNAALLCGKTSEEMLASLASPAANSSRSASPTTVLNHLSNDDIRRLVDILKISHPQAVASALALIQPVNSTTVAEISMAGNCKKRLLYSTAQEESAPLQKRRKFNDGDQ